MARTVGKLVPVGLKSLAPGYHADGGNLWLRVTGANARNWLFRFDLNGRRREMGLGPLGSVTLAEARNRAREARELIAQGIDPIEDREVRESAARERARMTFDRCAALYIEGQRAGWRNAKHAAQWETTLRVYCGPVFGSKPVGAVTTELVLRVLSPIWITKTETASRLRGRIEAVLAWATTCGYRKGENPARWRGHLKHSLGEPGKVKKAQRGERHHPALPWREIGKFMPELRIAKGIGARAVEFVILTATRSGDVRGMRWDEVRGNVWTVPAGRIKSGVDHAIPLSAAALAVLEAMPKVSALVFPGTKRDKATRDFKPLSDMSLSAVLRRMNHEDPPRWTDDKGQRIVVHGFRSTFRDWAGDCAIAPREVAERALAHTLENKAEAAYSRSDLLERRRPMMEAWAKQCSRNPELASSTKVVALTKGAHA